METVKAGRIFKPDIRFLYKEWLTIFVVALFLYLAAMAFWLGIAYLMYLDGKPEVPDYNLYVNFWWLPANFWWWVANAVWMLPALLGTPFYIRSFEYSVRAMSGEVMPEIYVRKGLINVSEKHVPFRTITNILSRAGPFDRLFGIGSVEIETAGMSGGPQGGAAPEEKIEGIRFYKELRDFILQELRKFTGVYATGTEVLRRVEEPVPSMPDSLDDEILTTLREMRDILERIENKFGKEE
jgi:membrane protein YdbS with pleckstrin-like domain